MSVMTAQRGDQNAYMPAQVDEWGKGIVEVGGMATYGSRKIQDRFKTDLEAGLQKKHTEMAGCPLIGRYRKEVMTRPKRGKKADGIIRKPTNAKKALVPSSWNPTGSGRKSLTTQSIVASTHKTHPTVGTNRRQLR
ncbi:MAG: hypothetical protein Q9213_004563 [Squamulea squamosa]